MAHGDPRLNQTLRSPESRLNATALGFETGLGSRVQRGVEEMIRGNLAAPLALVVGLGAFVSTASAPAFAKGAGEADAASAQSSTCLSTPKGAAPAGERWFYRVERGTKRHCWYTRGGSTRTAVAKSERATVPATEPEPPPVPTEPLELSVANARAEAGVVLPPPEPQDVRTPPIRTAETARNPAWTLADRWSQSGGEPAPTPAPSRAQSTSAPSAPVAAPDVPSAAVPETDESLLGIAAAVVALLGLTIVLVAVLMRRRRREQSGSEWQPSPPEALTDLNDRPLMTWRKGVQDQLRTTQRRNTQRDSVADEDEFVSSADFEGFPRRRKAPPAARA